jgi:hypothetical protein
MVRNSIDDGRKCAGNRHHIWTLLLWYEEVARSASRENIPQEIEMEVVTNNYGQEGFYCGQKWN